LSAAIEQQIEHNSVTEFYVGNHGRFDALACHVLREAKQKYPDIRCYLVLAYHPGAAKTELPESFDGCFYPLEKSVPPRYALPRANRAMIKQCDVLIAAVYRPGRSREVLQHARRIAEKERIQIINLLEK